MTWILDSSGTQTATIGVEHVLDAPATTGTYVFAVDANALANGDLLELRVYDLVSSGLKKAWKGVYQHIQISPGKFSPPITITGGARFTLKQVAGTAQSFPWSVRRAYSGSVLPQIVTWNPGDLPGTQIALTNGDLTARDNSGSTYSNVRATHPLTTTKKYYFEFVVDTVSSAATLNIGLANISFGPTGNLLGTVNSIGTRDDQTNTGFWFLNFGNAGDHPAGAWGTASTVVGIAADGVNKKIWSTLNGSVWNSTGGTPTAGTGFADFSTITGPWYPTFCTSAFNNKITARFDPASFTLATLNTGPLAGFFQWGS